MSGRVFITALHQIGYARERHVTLRYCMHRSTDQPRVAEYYSVEVPGILHARSGYAREARLEPLRFLRLALQGKQLLDGRCGQQLARRMCILGIVLPQPRRRSTLRIGGGIGNRAHAQPALCVRTRSPRCACAREAIMRDRRVRAPSRPRARRSRRGSRRAPVARLQTAFRR